MLSKQNIVMLILSEFKTKDEIPLTNTIGFPETEVCK